MALFSIPFAFTERFFYPSYWEPTFLFGLADKIGFGIEDILFVVGLSAFTSTSYAFFFKQRYEAIGFIQFRSICARCIALLGSTFLLVAIAVLLDIAMIYASFFIMLCISLFIFFHRNDLLLPSMIGGILSVTVYSLLCLCYNALFPDIFKIIWHSDQFLNKFFLGIPVEELMYGFAAGLIATAFYPYVFYKKMIKKG